jgi:hypothetical protein
MRVIRLIRTGTAAMAALLYLSIPAPAGAATQSFNVFMNEVRAASEMEGNMLGVRFVVGNKIFQPGREFKSGTGWLGLACTAKACTLQPAVLAARPASWQGKDDGKPTGGQQLVFRLAAPSSAKVVAWFSAAPGSPAWLKAGPVTTWYGGTGRPKPTGAGSFEAKIDGPGGTLAVLVPMALNKRYAPALAQLWDSSLDGTVYFLQLRSEGRRQLLPGQLGTCSRTVSPDADYLLWAGDLDGDGKPDYLINYAEAGGQQHLYLSTMARPGQIVGLAGQHAAPPDDFECDTEGWKL